MDRALNFSLNQKLIADEKEYQVIGGIEFSNPSDGSSWVEYCIKETASGAIRWLSIDNLYEEYAIYNQCSYSHEFAEKEIERAGYHESDSGTAKVVRSFGKVDASSGDQVRYVEYEDGTGEEIISIETWEDETEYSKGCYLDWNEIVPMGQETPGNPGNLENQFTYKSPVKWIWPVAILLLFCIGTMPFLLKPKTPLKEFLQSSIDFIYKTSITSDLNNKEKADVYETNLTVDSAAKCLIEGINGNAEEVQSGEDGSVAILTDNEYCVIYPGTEGEVLVQISSRDYVRQSTNTLYHSSPYSHSYYRSFYYSRGYDNDRIRRKTKTDGFEGYSGDTLTRNYSDPYNTYSDSIRQNSINSRTSTGGGTSFGK